MQTSRATMARVIEPIGLLALLLRRTRTKTITTATSATAINNTINGNQFRTLSSCSMTIRNRSLMINQNYIATINMRIHSRFKSSSSSSPTNSIIFKGKDPKTPEKKKKAGVIKKLYKVNKEMFGELLETQKEKTKRVKKETKQSKQKLKAAAIKTKLMSLESGIILSDENEMPSEINTPKSIPMSEPPVLIDNEVPSYSIKSSRNQTKNAEINWTLKNNLKMTKIISRSASYNTPTAKTALPFGGDGQGEFVLLTRQSQNESLPKESRGATDATRSPQGQSSLSSSEGDDAYTGEAFLQSQQLPSVEQFITSFNDFQDMGPRCETKVVQKPSRPLGKNNNLMLNTIDNNISTEAIEQLEESSSSSSFIEEMKEFKSSHNTHYNNRSSSPGTKGPVPVDVLQTGQEQMTTEGDSKNKKAGGLLQQNGNVVKGMLDNVEKAASLKMAGDGPSDNVHNQKTSSSLIINVPYFNPERQALASAFATEEKHLDPNPDSHEDDNNHNNNSINQTSQIISIPFPRIFYNNKNDFRKKSSETVNTKRNKDDLTKTDQSKKVQLPSVSKILNVTMPKEQAEALERWQAKMIAEMGEEGFRLYKENMLNNGKMLHSNIESYLRGTPLDEISVADTIAGHWNSMKDVLVGVQGVKVLESRVVHPKLMYCGIVDCVALFRNKLVVIDWKTSQKQKPFVSMTYDTPLQIAAYIGAINYDPNYSLKIDEGLIVIAYEDGTISQTFFLNSTDVAKYWKRWLARLNLYQQQMNQLASS